MTNKLDHSPYEEMARLEATAMLYHRRATEQADRILELEASISRLEDEGVKSQKVEKLSEKLSDALSSLAQRDALLDKLKSALVAKEKVRFELETKLRSILARGDISVQIRSGTPEPRPDVTSDLLSDAHQPAKHRTSTLQSVPLVNSRAMLTDHVVRSSRTLSGAVPAYPALSFPSKGFLFVMTYPRSGDLVLQKMLNTLPGYCIRGELGAALRPISRLWAETVEYGWRTANAASDLASVDFGWQIADGFVANALSPPDGIRVAGFRNNEVFSEAEDFWDVASFLYANFPDARIIFNKRNAERVSRIGPWAQQPQDEVVKKLKRMNGFFNDFVRAYPERATCVTYEEYIHLNTLPERLYEFLGEPADLISIQNV